MKKCTKCGKTKPLDDFSRRSEVPSGRASQCRACQKEKAARYYKANRERIIEQTNAYRRAHLEQGRKYSRKWANANRDKIREYNQKVIQRDPEAWRARSKAWEEANPEKVLAKNQRRRARKRDAFVANVYLGKLILRDEGRCGICEEPIMGPIDVDHIIPLIAGGTHEPDNCQIAHPSCNRRKHTRADYRPAA